MTFWTFFLYYLGSQLILGAIYGLYQYYRVRQMQKELVDTLFDSDKYFDDLIKRNNLN